MDIFFIEKFFGDRFFKLIFLIFSPTTTPTIGATKVNKTYCSSKRYCGNISYNTRKYIANPEKIINFKLLSLILILEKIVDGWSIKNLLSQIYYGVCYWWNLSFYGQGCTSWCDYLNFDFV